MKPRFCLPVFASFIALFTLRSVPASADEHDGHNSAQVSIAGAPREQLSIPGPLRSFLRMAGISQKITTDEVVPLLARNIYLQGYHGNRQTEFLILLTRYVHQARELQDLAGATGVLKVTNCDDAKQLLRILGYRARQDCGQRTASLVTADPERAFLTTDSGFPLNDLEEALQGRGPFEYAYPSSPVPLLLAPHDWVAASKESAHDTNNNREFLDTLLRDHELARLYWAMSRMDPETRAVLAQPSMGLAKLVPFASLLDLYGTQISIRASQVIVPGGSAAEADWKDLVGASPDSPTDFIAKLVKKDKGWLIAYFDALSRANHTQQAHFLPAHRIKRFYEAFRAPGASADAAARLAFRPAPSVLVLVNRLEWDSAGNPRVPGNLSTWREILRQKSDSKIVRNAGKHSGDWQHPDQLGEAMFTLARSETETGPLQAYLFLSELDARRPSNRLLQPQTVSLLADKYADFSSQFLIFTEFPQLTDASMLRFVAIAETLGSLSNHTLRGNAMGTFQANVGLWQILARQGQIEDAKLDRSWQEVIEPFAKVATAPQLFDAGRGSLTGILRAALGSPVASQDRLIELLAGPPQVSPEGRRMHREVANRIRSVMDGQRLVSLDALLALGDGLTELSKGANVSDRLLPLAAELREFEMPRPIFTGRERTEWAAGTYNNRHTELQMRTDLTKVIKSKATPVQLEEARGEMVPFLRDTLVGLNYAYYEPPGAQILHNNPLFVRSHDFSGDTVIGVEHLWQSSHLFGAGSPAGGGAHLIGSLADLPYVLGEVEQDFLSPDHVQALIWKQLVPGLLTTATLPRWWNVSRTELHAAALYQRAGEELLLASASDEKLRGLVLGILSDRLVPQRLASLDQVLRDGRSDEILARTAPADTFYLTAEFRSRYPDEINVWGVAGRDLDGLAHQSPAEVGRDRLSQDFGVPHPVLAQTYGRDLLNLKPFPALGGYCSRLMAESWDSSNLYWARLADEMDYSPVVLNRLVPELTRRMVERIFATELEDWPAVLRAMREAGEELRNGKMAGMTVSAAGTRP